MENKIKAALAVLFTIIVYLAVLYGMLHYAHFLGVLVIVAAVSTGIVFLYKTFLNIFNDNKQ